MFSGEDVRMGIGKMGLVAMLLGSLAGGAQAGEYRKEGWPVPEMDGYRYQISYPDCRDGDGEKETIVEILKDSAGDMIFKYRLNLRNGGKGDHVWAIEGKDGTIVDSRCTGNYDMMFRLGDKVPVPECVKQFLPK
jgi:hypothetical protein